MLFQLLAVAIPILIGLVRYWTTRFRISDERIELERGLISRHAVSTPLDRVRTVDLTASPIHRLLGPQHGPDRHRLAPARAGLDLDGLATGQARELRARLLPLDRPAGARPPRRTRPTPAANGWSPGSSPAGCGTRRSRRPGWC